MPQHAAGWHPVFPLKAFYTPRGYEVYYAQRLYSDKGKVIEERIAIQIEEPGSVKKGMIFPRKCISLVRVLVLYQYSYHAKDYRTCETLVLEDSPNGHPDDREIEIWES